VEEFELKFLEVDVAALEKKLLSIGAEKVGEYDYAIVVFDYPDLRLDKDESWLKLRTGGKKTTLSFKKRMGVKSNDGSIPDEGMQEVEIIVDDYKKTQELLKSIGMVVKREMVKKRIRYQKGKAVFDIDFWPEIPAYIEIESDSVEGAKEAACELGFDPENGLICSAQQVYTKYGYDMNDYSSVNFEGMIKK
jgi:adenylate cyclase class 2